MSARIVMVGPMGTHSGVVRAAEVNAQDASAFVNNNGWRVSLTRFDGPLADATVLMMVGEPSYSEQVSRWGVAMQLCFMAEQFEIPVPLSVSHARFNPWDERTADIHETTR